MTLLVTGASGFIGSHTARAAAARGMSVRCLVRPASDLSLLRGTVRAESGELGIVIPAKAGIQDPAPPPRLDTRLRGYDGPTEQALCAKPWRGLNVQTVVGDLTENDSLRQAVDGAEAVVHCAGTTSETAPDPDLSYRTNVLGTENLIEACRQCGVDRLVFIGSLSANEENTGTYGTTKLQAERAVAASGLRFTVLRPATVYGPGARGLFAKIGRYVARLPLIPIVGSGAQRFRPIHVDDVAAAVLSCLEAEVTVGQSYDLGGLDGVSFEQFIDGVGEAFGKKRAKVHLPVPACLLAAKALALFLRNPPLTVDNIVGLTQMRECDIAPARADFGFSPMSFSEGIAMLRRDLASQ